MAPRPPRPLWTTEPPHQGLWTTKAGSSRSAEASAPVRTDPPLPTVFTLARAGRAGLTADQARRRVLTGQWHRLLPGVFCRSDLWRAASPEHRHALLARGVRVSYL